MSRKLPALNADNAPFWQGGAQGQLLIHFCSPCGRYFHPPAPVCPCCASFDVAPKAVSGTGKVMSFTINHQAWVPGLVVPYAVAIVALDDQEGLHFLTNVVDCPVEEVAIDMPVRVKFLNIEDVWLPQFERNDHV
jgi:hypothetical protein